MIIGVLGAGSWGTALAVLLARNGHEVQLVGRSSEGIEEIQAARENVRYLPDVQLPDSISVSTVCQPGAEFWINAVPASGTRSSLSCLPRDAKKIILASKGLEPVTAKLLSDVVTEELPAVTVGAIGGPNLATEVVRGIPTATLCASTHEDLAHEVCAALNCTTFRAYYAEDLIGVELCGALKNVLAIGAGISDGLGFGDNTKGALLARGLREMTVVGAKLGAQLETFFGIAGVGDLFATANSRLSRNYRVGFAVGQGRSVDAAVMELGQVAEGVSTSKSVRIIAQEFQAEVPILSSIHLILSGELAPREAVHKLMEREPQREVFDRQ